MVSQTDRQDMKPHVVDCSMRRHVVIFNWRDITHPQAGGAERVTHEVARRWVRDGHEVTLFTAAYPGAMPHDVIDGVSVVRRGSQTTVHLAARRYYEVNWRGRCDLVIDEVNTIPFFTPLYVREPVLMLNHQLAREVWMYEAPFPVNVVGFAIEPLYLQAYRHTPVMTISRSSRDSLRVLGFQGPFYIVPMAVDTPALAALPPLAMKDEGLVLLFVGRVVPSKRVHDIVRALGRLHASGRTEARLWIVGGWDNAYRRFLTRLIGSLGLTEAVTFFGRVDGATREDLMQRAHLCVMASIREGWGLVVTESARLGTPSVVYDVPGLRDSTIDGVTGRVCAPAPSAMASSIASLVADSEAYDQMRRVAWETASALNWDTTARIAWHAVESCLS